MAQAENSAGFEAGSKMAFVLGYFLFTAALFLILTFLKKFPESWTYFHLMAATLAVPLLGMGIKRLLK